MNEQFRRRAKRNDRIARWVITLAGLAVIFSVILILVLITNVTLPLFQKPDAKVYAKFKDTDSSAQTRFLAIGVDDYRETGYRLATTGRLSFFETLQGAETDAIQLSSQYDESATIVGIEDSRRLEHTIAWSDGSATLIQVIFKPFFDEANNNKRVIQHEVRRLLDFPPGESGTPARLTFARIDDEGRKTRVDLQHDSSITITQLAVSSSLFGGGEEEQFVETLNADHQAPITTLAMDSKGQALYAGTSDGQLLRWDLEEPGQAKLLDNVIAFTDHRAITALGLVFGDYSLAVGDVFGQLTVWFPVRTESNSSDRVLRKIHDLAPHDSAVVAIRHSLRDKSILSLSESGKLHLDHMTSERHLLTLGNHSPLNHFAFSTRSDSIIGMTTEGTSIVWQIDNPHPEVSWKTLFGKVWYEGYDEPAYVWQSSAASDDFEPKLSLTPLIFGTLKGTFYAMIFAVPLALFGAIYTSQFCRPRLREFIKPTVEIMAAVPTVIIGFLAALWLAPLIKVSLGALFLSLIMLPAGLMLAIFIWQGLRHNESLKGIERGYEFVAIVPVIILMVAIASTLGPAFEDLFFNGDLAQWLFTELGTRYDPRNCIIIAFAMGFAVIPIIFTIAEDSLSNVPPALKAASLACGASRWQTVWRVILPSASPGIFAGTMIGFGRAVGETMIVLMATGNTPIMDWSIFNGMRPLSSNIAVEIPEAPFGGTLYRVLFLSAVILFVMTFIVNTVAEIIRQRLRKKYGRF
jgi:phosphate transport system permease protein